MGKQTRFRTCHLCEAMCGLELVMEDEMITSVRGDSADPFSRGHICPKAAALTDIHNDPNRLRAPVKREGDQWTEISWDEAYDMVADNLLRIRQQHGEDAFGVYLGNPAVHNYGMLTHGPQFLKLMKTRNRFSASSVDQWPHQFAAYFMFGHQFMIPIPDIDHTQYFLMLGANPLASNGSLMTTPDVRQRLKGIADRGGKLVVIDPRRTETAAMAQEHHFIRPGGDAALLAALLNVMVEENLIKPGPLAEIADGLDLVLQKMDAFTPEKAAAATGMEPQAIRQIARDMCAAESAVCYGRMGVSVQAYGGLCQWLIQIINIATGNLDKPGGAMFTLPAFDLVGMPKSRRGHYDLWRSRVSDLPEFAGELPVVAMAEEMLTEGEGQIRAFMSAAGNPVLSTPNGPKLEKALSGLDFMFSVDFYINETTRFADVILPPVSPLETDHFDMIFPVFAVRNYVRYSEPLYPKPEGGREDWEIFTQLSHRIMNKMGAKPGPDMTPSQMVGYAVFNGPYGQGVGHPLKLSMDKLLENPHGIDLGPLQPQLPDRLFHADKRIQCAPEPMMRDLERLSSDLFAGSIEEGLVLIGRRDLRSNNSWMHNYQRLVKGKDRCTLLMNPADLERRDLQDGQKVTVASRVGSLEVAVQASDTMMPGVVSLPHGWGHDRGGVKLDVALEHAGVSINDLTDETRIDPVSGNAALTGVPVTVG